MQGIRIDCPMRNRENGNCLPMGGFCTASNEKLCKAMHSAYDMGVRAGIKEGHEIAKHQNGTECSKTKKE